MKKTLKTKTKDKWKTKHYTKENFWKQKTKNQQWKNCLFGSIEHGQH